MTIYKIGGSSLNSEYKLNSIYDMLLKNYEKKIIVVSAIGRYPEPYSTDSLLIECDNVSKEERDLLVSTGEIISSVKLSNFLNKKKIKSVALSPYLFCIYNINKNYIDSLFKEYECIIIPGYIYTKDNVIYTMQRGGSTLTSAILASEFNADLIIITDVCGIYTNDPSCEESKHIPILTYDDFLDLNKTDRFFSKDSIKLLKENNITTTFIKYDQINKISKIIP